ncbi:lamin tail domain-containing protein, partial [bacterium]|nr:lamin tail domain-containing protein [bacterium]
PPAGGATTIAAPVITAAAPATAPQYENAAVTIGITVLSPPSNAADEMSIYWRADGGAWQGVGASNQGGGAWSATIPGQSRDTVVDWWASVGGESGGADTWPNAAPFYFVSYTVLPPVDPGDGPAHLLLTEVCVSGSDHEFVEIYNPTGEAVDLSDYYLTDACYLTGNQGYWRLPEGNPSQTTVGGGDFFDFHARFPDGAMIQPGEVLTISMAGSTAFNGVWGMMPDLDLRADMREIFPGSLYNADGTNATLSNSAEIVVLYYWDGISDLVTDVDMFFWGTSTSARVDKTGYSIGGSTYAPDTPLASQDDFTAAHEIGGSFQRLDDAETGEPASGGNGPAGHDETGEPLTATWLAATGTPGSYGGSVLNITGVTRAPNAPEPDDTVLVTASIVAQETLTSVDLYYRTDGGVFTGLAMTDNLDGTWSATIPGFALDTVVEYYVDAADDQGGTAVWPAGAPADLAGYTVAEAPGPGDYPPHLLLTEVCVQGSDHEFVEIFNPTAETVNLGNYYLTDACYLTGNQGYWRLPEGNPSQTTVGGGDFFDFHARFPSGAVIEPGEALTVSLAGADVFNGVWGMMPDLDLRADMRELFAGSLHNADGTNATLSNGAEIVVLYYWDGASDLVTDIDMFFWGESTSARVDKSGYSIGASTYAPDTPLANQDDFTAAHEILGSFQRLALDETGETTSGGNGSLGHDETSEPLNTTWQAADGTPGAYGVIDLAVTGASLSPARPQPDEDATVTVSVTGTADVSTVTLHYAVDAGAYQDVACTDNGNGTWSGVIPGQAENAEVVWYVSVAGAGGETAVWPEGAPGTVEAYTVEIIVAGEGLARLLLTEIATLGSTAEFIEIHNPNDFDVELKNYYLTDAVYYEDQAYWNLPRGNPTQATVGGGAFSDFTARFPDDAVLPAGAYITVSMPGSGSFSEVFSDETTTKLPHYEMFEDADNADGVPDMEEVFPGSIDGDGAPTLTNLSDMGTYINGEIVVLFYWDGVSDLVVDIDIFIWGNGNSYTASKQGRTNGASTYASEAVYPDPFMTEHAHLQSYTRIDFDEGTEVQTGANGFEGADETSENLTTTWEVATADPAFAVQAEGTAGVTLRVPPRTFIPLHNETFDIVFTTAANSETVLRIFDLEGRLVRILLDSRFDYNPSTDLDFPSSEPWDGRNDVFELVKAGMYIVHLQVTDKKSGARVEKTAPAVVATRLSN